MEYKHFALLSIDRELVKNEELTDLIRLTCNEITSELDLLIYR